MKSFFRMLLTGKDNETFEIARVLLFIGFASVLLFSGYDVLGQGHSFDALGYCTGLSALLFGGAGGIALKARTEPEPPRDV